MPRRKRVYKKTAKVDPKYGNLLVGKFIGNIMLEGKRSTAEKIVYDAFDAIHARTKKGGLNVFEQAIKNVSPLVELKSRRVTLAIRWIKKAMNTKKGKKTAEKLADELIDASNKTGVAIKKREDVHRMADANKAFAHFA